MNRIRRWVTTIRDARDGLAAAVVDQTHLINAQHALAEAGWRNAGRPVADDIRDLAAAWADAERRAATAQALMKAINNVRSSLDPAPLRGAGVPGDPTEDPTPRQRWGTCCPADPECEHSFLDSVELARWLDSPLSDRDAAELEGDR